MASGAGSGALALVETEEERQSRHEAYLKRVKDVSAGPRSLAKMFRFLTLSRSR